MSAVTERLLDRLIAGIAENRVGEKGKALTGTQGMDFLGCNATEWIEVQSRLTSLVKESRRRRQL